MTMLHVSGAAKRAEGSACRARSRGGLPRHGARGPRGSRRLATTLAAFLLVLGLLASTGGALAAPAITLTPAVTSPGGKVTIAGSGFAANAALALLQEGAPGQRFPIATVTAGADGSFQYVLTVPGGAPPGTSAIVVASSPDMTELARATLTVTNEPSVAPERVTITPATGPAGTPFALAGTGLAPGATLVWHTGQPGRFAGQGTFRVGADGRFAVTIDSTGYAPGRYSAAVSTELMAPPITSTEFTITAAPGLPNTGGGASTSGLLQGWLAVGCVALAGVGLLGWLGLGRRRRSPRRG